jgi:hypothetical protein
MVLFFKLKRIKNEKRWEQLVYPPFAGIILIRFAGIISASDIVGSTPVAKKLFW